MCIHVCVGLCTCACGCVCASSEAFLPCLASPLFLLRFELSSAATSLSAADARCLTASFSDARSLTSSCVTVVFCFSLPSAISASPDAAIPIAFVEPPSS